MRILRSFFIVAVCFIGLSCSNSTDTATNDNNTNTTAPQRVGNKNTKVFHTLNCRYVTAGLTNPINFDTRADAIAAGYSADASGACNP